MIGIRQRPGRGRPRTPGMIALWIVLGLLAAFAAATVVLPVVGVLVAILVMLAIFVGPWLLLGLGVYGATRLVQESRKRQPGMPSQRAHPPAVTLPRTAPAAAQRSRLPQLPPAVRTHAERIRLKARSLMERPTGSRLPPEDAYLVERTLRDYLPRALDAYLALPPGSADWPVSPDGRTGHQLLHGQLQILERNLDAAAGRVWRSGAERLLAHQRFLEERFGKDQGPPGELDLPSPAGRTPRAGS
jgi:hypothetical protein